ncbi:hypothetical protein CERZMDRAFT_102323 [Cercospora zeae-maydis SCOH1-5]|uniref:Uncharacterized protein n=1 Tax=Cercospora zeae-maydis SCOH1-5 TaxID=717836 RepID=A0A6A6F0D3_9PEZI|nr:hypothetical protein CERZMDRAFT_102323 [Cercospora zeae-maydis SCOH1-5]
MKLLLVGAAVNAYVAYAETGCCFHTTADGGPGGVVEQLFDGQNRIGQTGLKEGEYCINTQGGLVDSNGRGCILTPPTSQWQCDAGAQPTKGFYVGADGILGYNSSSQFWACPTGDNGGWNIYGNQPLPNEPKCVPTKLFADKCKASEPPADNPAPPESSQCPGYLPKGYEFPHLIVPVNEAERDKCYGTSYNGTAGRGLSSVFNFDIPTAAKGKTCDIRFLFPTQRQLETSAYTFSSSDGGFTLALLDDPATERTTFANLPKVKQDLGRHALAPGAAFDIASMACPAGNRFSVWLQAKGDSYIDFFQDYNPCPIGLYVIPH